MHTARDHHYAPRFFLRNFATDPAKTKIATVAKNGQYAVWAERSIDGVGFDRDFYVHLRNGVPISVEDDINRRIETPISQSDTWAKIVSGRTDTLDRSDKAILYALIRHLEVRTPHYRQTQIELAQLAASTDSGIPFTDDEREHYDALRADPDMAKAMFDYMSSSHDWSEPSFKGCGLSVFRSPIPLLTSSNPAITLPAPAHPALALPLPGMLPYQLVLTLNPHTIVSLALGDFDDAFANIPIEADVARGFNRYFMGHFAHFDKVRHLITDRHNLLAEMEWAHYRMLKETSRKIVFFRGGSELYQE